jgi:hypothetical protein
MTTKIQFPLQWQSFLQNIVRKERKFKRGQNAKDEGIQNKKINENGRNLLEINSKGETDNLHDDYQLLSLTPYFSLTDPNNKKIQRKCFDGKPNRYHTDLFTRLLCDLHANCVRVVPKW